MTFTILLTCIGGELQPHVTRMLKSSPRHDVRVVGVDVRDDVPGRHFVDVFATVPRGADPGYPAAIAELVRRHQVDLVLPTSDEEALALSANRDVVEAAGAQLACAEAWIIRAVSDKAAAYAKLKELGVPVPDFRTATSLDQLDTAVAEMTDKHGDIVVKPAQARGGRGVCVVRADLTGIHPYDGGRELHMDLDSFRTTQLAEFANQLPAVVMPRLVEPVYDIDMLAWQGRPVRVVPRRRVDSALPNEGHTIVGNPELIALGTRLIEALGLSWLYDCDVMYDRHGQPMILEINPRPSGSIAATITAGIPLLDDLIALAKGEPVAEMPLPIGRKVVPFKALAVVEA